MKLPESISSVLSQLTPALVPFEEAHPDESVVLRRMLLPDNAGKIWYRLVQAEGEDEPRLIGLNLHGLDLQEDQLRFLKKEAFSHLQALGLGGNGCTVLEIPSTLNALAYLDLSNSTQLRKLVFSQGMASLKYLDASNCRLEELVFPAGFEQLSQVFLNENRSLEKLTLYGDFPNLEYLYFPNCAVKSFPLTDQFPGLRHLFAPNNRIERLTLGRTISFPVLETLALGNNQIREILPEMLTGMPNLVNLSVANNPLPASILSNIGKAPHEDLAFLKRYLEVADKGQEMDDECKILLIGNGKVGKSTFLKRLIYDDFQYEYTSTHAIVVEERYEGDERTKPMMAPFVWNIWDFAGQDIYHATHRLFMQANAVYLVLWDHETEHAPFNTIVEQGEVRQYENYSLLYWLYYAKYRGKGSPAILVQTKVGLHGIKEVPGEIFRIFDRDFVIAAHQIESSEANFKRNGYHTLIASIASAIDQLKEQQNIPSYWDRVRERVRELQNKGEKWISLETFRELAQEYHEPEDILRWLTQSGAVFYQEGLFKEIILNQQWAIDAIYALFDREQHYYELKAKKGEFSGEDLARIWSAHPPNVQELFVSFMRSCEMCFEVTPGASQNLPFKERRFVAPQLLPEKNDPLREDFWEGREALYMRYEHKHFHYGIIQSFIVRTHHLATHLGESRDIWKMGIILKESGEFAQIDAFSKRIEVKVTRGGKFLLDKIRNELEELSDLNQQKAEGGAEADQDRKIVFSLDGNTYMSAEAFDTLMGKEKILTEGIAHGEPEPHSRFSRPGFREEEPQVGRKGKPVEGEGRRPYRVFISYANKDALYFNCFKEEFEVHIGSSSLEIEEVWSDENIPVGEDWDEKIRHKMNEVDIAVLLLSPRFLNSDYIYAKEFKRFLERSNEGTLLIFPIFFMPCKMDVKKWESLYKLQFFKPDGARYGLAGKQAFSFSDLVPSSSNGAPIPSNPDRDRYFIDLVDKLEDSADAWLKRG